MNRTDIFYDVKHAEELRCDDFHEAVEMILDAMDCKVSDLPETIEIYRYKRMKVNKNVKSDAQGLLEDIYERLDEEYGGPDNYSEPTKQVMEIAESFLTRVYSLYVPWTCEVDGPPIKVNVKDWIKKNAPHWLEEVE